MNMFNFTLNREIKVKEQKWIKLEFKRENKELVGVAGLTIPSRGGANNKEIGRLKPFLLVLHSTLLHRGKTESPFRVWDTSELLYTSSTGNLNELPHGSVRRSP